MSYVIATEPKNLLAQIEQGEYDDDLGQIISAAQRRMRRVRIMRRPESPIVGEFMAILHLNPGSTARELSALMGVTPARIYQIAKQADRHVKPEKVGEYPRKFWPAD